MPPPLLDSPSPLVSSPLLPTPLKPNATDNQNQAIRTATQTAIGTAAGGGTPRVDPTRAAGAIQATQAMARGTQSTSTRQIDAQAATTAAIRSGNAEAATTTGAITTGIAGGSSIVNSVTMATATPGSVHAPPPALPPTGNRAVPAAAQRGGVTTTTGNRAATAPSGSRARASAPRTTTTTTTTTHNTAAHKGAATTTTAAHHASPKASPHMVTATQPGRAPAPAPKP